MSLKSFILQSLFVLLFCTSFLSAQDPFKLDKYGKHKAYVGSINYPDTVITREHLILEAKRVWEFLPEKHGPAMVSALSTGDGKIYFATSIRDQTRGPNKQTDLGFPKMLTDALQDCTGTDHVFGGKCAELKVIAEWYNQNGHVQLPASGKLIVAVNYNREVVEPCSETAPGGTRFGCVDVLPNLGFTADEIVTTDPACQMRRRGFGGLIERGCVPKKHTAKHSPPGKPAPKKPTAQAPRQGKPKPPSNNRPKSTLPKMPAKSKAPSNRGPKPAPPRLPAKPKARSNKGPKR